MTITGQVQTTKRTDDAKMVVSGKRNFTATSHHAWAHPGRTATWHAAQR